VKRTEVVLVSPVSLQRTRAERWANGLLALLVVGVAGAIALGLIAGPPCPLARYLHVLCPMCGTTRAVHRFLAGDVLGAFRLNPLFLCWCGLAASAYAELLHRAAGRPGAGPGERLLRGTAARPVILRSVQVVLAMQAIWANTVLRDVLMSPGLK
jgi:hypothetical protein